MKNIVITGSARGLGFEMAKEFRRLGHNVVISDLKEENLKDAESKLNEVENEAKVLYKTCNVTSFEDLQELMNFAIENLNTVDIWINNAGINQPMDAIWELTKEETDSVIDVNLKGAIFGSQIANKQMQKQGYGAIYDIDGYGSNDATMLGLSIYGTSKRGLKYFMQALAKENETKKTGVIVGRLSPGIMITKFISNALGDKEKINLPEKTKKVYNILGDTPDVVAKFLVNGMLKNTKNNSCIEWLTPRKAAWRFMTAGFNKRDFFNN